MTGGNGRLAVVLVRRLVILVVSGTRRIDSRCTLSEGSMTIGDGEVLFAPVERVMTSSPSHPERRWGRCSTGAELFARTYFTHCRTRFTTREAAGFALCIRDSVDTTLEVVLGGAEPLTRDCRQA